jgi:hypothetical protein
MKYTGFKPGTGPKEDTFFLMIALEFSFLLGLFVSELNFSDLTQKNQVLDAKIKTLDQL